MKIVFITRSTAYTGRGGDTVQVLKTAEHLRTLDVEVDVKLSNEVINYDEYDLLHFFNIPRPADMLRHSKASNKPYVISTILLDHSEYDKYFRRGAGRLLKFFSADAIEYIKTIARCLLGKDYLASKEFIWKGQRRCIKELIKGAAILLPNSPSEYERLVEQYGLTAKYRVIPNGVEQATFNSPDTDKYPDMVLCVARIEGNKNQLNLIKALNNTRFKVVVVGKPAPNQLDYYAQCRKIAAANIEFIDYLPLKQLVEHYRWAKVHALPSWFETTGLSTLEAAAMGCNIVITNKGDTQYYFEDYAFYCDPSSPESIYKAVDEASQAAYNKELYYRILENFTWQKTAEETLKAYQAVIPHSAQPHETVIAD
ncbi:glycosyltransferase family 4 protein [Mucilaginibacter boryungensis]|uniref:Glycosyltransferase family 4 protein n=1 Tax=Mucilaginibacter boryungensis TaxID=768480 RepID=A0ABR9XG40_9SPHI|nr:glycosyltransferase family 4 protein [Mucilaginibacter boryungensis]MBE9666357.1 glycosyltransferase family 4 protein [Mucilaginibacter boryungensis]